MTRILAERRSQYTTETLVFDSSAPEADRYTEICVCGGRVQYRRTWERDEVPTRIRILTGRQAEED